MPPSRCHSDVLSIGAVTQRTDWRFLRSTRGFDRRRVDAFGATSGSRRPGAEMQTSREQRSSPGLSHPAACPARRLDPDFSGGRRVRRPYGDSCGAERRCTVTAYSCHESLNGVRCSSHSVRSATALPSFRVARAITVATWPQVVLPAVAHWHSRRTGASCDALPRSGAAMARVKHSRHRMIVPSVRSPTRRSFTPCGLASTDRPHSKQVPVRVPDTLNGGCVIGCRSGRTTEGPRRPMMRTNGSRDGYGHCRSG
jgi:hypothetical protein